MNERDYKLTLANKITIARILFTPVFVLLLLYYMLGLKEGSANEYYRFAALLMFCLLALTDALDGYAARSRGEVTRLGRILDPIADKALVVSALALLTRPSLASFQPQFPVGFTFLVISRDVFLVVGAFVINHFAGTVHVHPRLAGKAATALLLLAVGYVLMGWPPGPFRIVIWGISLLIVISWAQYLVDGVRQIERSPHH